MSASDEQSCLGVSMSSFERLIREHDAIEALTMSLADLALSYPPDPEVGSVMLAELAGLVRGHLA